MDEFTRRCITLDVSRGFKSTDIIDRLSDPFVMYGIPEHIRSDNGPEFIAKAIRDWLSKLGVKTLYIEPGSPWENGFTESFNSRLRDELLRVEQFANAAHVRAAAAAWREDYNDYRPHSSLDGLPRRNSQVAVLLPLWLRHRSSSTATIYPFPLPKHNSHYTWTKMEALQDRINSFATFLVVSQLIAQRTSASGFDRFRRRCEQPSQRIQSLTTLATVQNHGKSTIE